MVSQKKMWMSIFAILLRIKSFILRPSSVVFFVHFIAQLIIFLCKPRSLRERSLSSCLRCFMCIFISICLNVRTSYCFVYICIEKKLTSISINKQKSEYLQLNIGFRAIYAAIKWESCLTSQTQNWYNVLNVAEITDIILSFQHR